MKRSGKTGGAAPAAGRAFGRLGVSEAPGGDGAAGGLGDFDLRQLGFWPRIEAAPP